jgi:hypothetical protein
MVFSSIDLAGAFSLLDEFAATHTETRFAREHNEPVQFTENVNIRLRPACRTAHLTKFI